MCVCAIMCVVERFITYVLSDQFKALECESLRDSDDTQSADEMLLEMNFRRFSYDYLMCSHTQSHCACV